MRYTFIACALTVAVGTGTQAQLGRPGRSETSQRLSDAVTAKQSEEAKSAPLNAARASLVDTADKARSELAQPVPADQAAMEAAQQRRLAEALQNLSPEGKSLLAQASQPAAAVPATAPTSAATAAPAETGGAPKPKPLKPEPLTEPQAPDTKQTIITGDLTYFDSSNSIAVFVGNVVVDSPQFHITCDEFEVHMRKDATTGPTAAPAKTGPDGKPVPAKAGAGDAKGAKGAKAAPAPAAKPDLKTVANTAPAKTPGTGGDSKATKPVFDAEHPADTSIESAIAKGRKVVIVKHNPDGKVQIGQSRYAYYDGNTGDITLRESPQVQDGDNLHISLEPSTVMILTQAGALHTTGRSRTDLMQADQDKNNPQSGGKPAGVKGAAAPGTAPAPSKGGLSIPGPVPGQ